jgi:hypothetical protein
VTPPVLLDREEKYLRMWNQIVFQFVTDAPYSFILQIPNYFDESFQYIPSGETA